MPCRVNWLALNLQPAAVTTPTHSGPTFLGMPPKPAPAAAPAAAAPAASVTRNARGQATSLNPQKSVTKTQKKSAPKKTSATVTRDARGRAVSLKNK